MAGTLTISTLSDGTNSTSSTNCIQGSAKAWAKLNLTSTPTVFASYNISSVTRNSAGVFTLAFTNALADANYGIVCTSTNISSTATNFAPFVNGTYTASAVQISAQSGSTYTDPGGAGYVQSVSVFR